jgi:hypothetical protein
MRNAIAVRAGVDVQFMNRGPNFCKWAQLPGLKPGGASKPGISETALLRPKHSPAGRLHREFSNLHNPSTRAAGLFEAAKGIAKIGTTTPDQASRKKLIDEAHLRLSHIYYMNDALRCLILERAIAMRRSLGYRSRAGSVLLDQTAKICFVNQRRRVPGPVPGVVQGELWTMIIAMNSNRSGQFAMVKAWSNAGMRLPLVHAGARSPCLKLQKVPFGIIRRLLFCH